MNSMTGYGKGCCERDGLSAVVELRSVNHRFLDLSMKLPRTLGFLEDVFRKELQRVLARGHVDVYLTLTDSGESNSVAEIDFAKADALVSISKQLSERYDLQNDFTVASLIRSYDVVSFVAAEADENKIREVAVAALIQAEIALTEMRAREGNALKIDLEEKLAQIESNLESIKLLAPQALDVHRAKLVALVDELKLQELIDAQRVAAEVAGFADKIAIDEETSRLGTHIEHARELFAQSSAQGRKLDFLIQEFNRETNTIGSKCNDVAITQLVLDTKNCIEKMREQIQNIE